MNKLKNKIKENKYVSLLSNTAVLGIGVFASKILVFLMMPFYTGILSPEEYGTADLISQTANLIIPLACVGITDGIFRFTMDKDGDKRSVLSSGLFVLTISSVIFLLLSPLIGLVGYFKNYVVLIALYVISANIHSVCAQYLRASGKTTAFAVQGLINTALVIILNIVFLVGFDMGVEGYVLSVIVSNAIISLILIFPFKLYRDIKIRLVNKTLIKQLLKYSIPMIPATIFWWITSVSDRYMVTYFSGSAENGLYTAAYKIPTILTLLSTVFMEAWQYSAVAEDDGEGANEKIKFFSEVFKYYQSLIFLACSAIIALSQVFIFLLCAENYGEAWRFVPVLTLSAVFSGFTAFLGSVYLLQKKSLMTFITSMVGAIVNIGLNFALIPLIGAQGASIATLVSYLAVFIIRAINTKKYLNFSLHINRMILNVLVIGGQIALILLLPQYIWVTQPICFVSVAAINVMPVISALKGTVKKYIKRKKI